MLYTVLYSTCFSFRQQFANSSRSLALVSRRRRYVTLRHRASESKPQPAPAPASHLALQHCPSQARSAAAVAAAAAAAASTRICSATAASRRSAAAGAGRCQCHECCFRTRAYRRCSNVLRYRDAPRGRAGESATIWNFPGVVLWGELEAQGVRPGDLSSAFPRPLRTLNSRTDHYFHFTYLSHGR